MSTLFFHKTPRLLEAILPNFTWRKSRRYKTIYLTFDDGPVPEATPEVLEQLGHYGAKATFFCVGDNIAKYPEVFQEILKAGHSVGNHTHHHLNGWQTSTQAFLKDVAECQQHLEHNNIKRARPLMRPPYGRLKRSQWRQLTDQYEIVMWDVLSGDFSSKIDKERCLNKTIQYTLNGSIVLFHDSPKTIGKLKNVLPAYLEHFSNLGYSFSAL